MGETRLEPAVCGACGQVVKCETCGEAIVPRLGDALPPADFYAIFNRCRRCSDGPVICPACLGETDWTDTATDAA